MRPETQQGTFVTVDPADQPAASKVLFLQVGKIMSMLYVDGVAEDSDHPFRVAYRVVDQPDGTEGTVSVVQFDRKTPYTMVDRSYLEFFTTAELEEYSLAQTAERVHTAVRRQRALNQGKADYDRLMEDSDERSPGADASGFQAWMRRALGEDDKGGLL